MPDPRRGWWMDGTALQVGCAGWILAAAVGCRILARVGSSPRLWMNNHPARLSVAEDGHRRGLISWQHQGTAAAEGK